MRRRLFPSWRTQFRPHLPPSTSPCSAESNHNDTDCRGSGDGRQCFTHRFPAVALRGQFLLTGDLISTDITTIVTAVAGSTRQYPSRRRLQQSSKSPSVFGQNPGRSRPPLPSPTIPIASPRHRLLIPDHWPSMGPCRSPGLLDFATVLGEAIFGPIPATSGSHLVFRHRRRVLHLRLHRS